jgi:hypothetical protein
VRRNSSASAVDLVGAVDGEQQPVGADGLDGSEEGRVGEDAGRELLGVLLAMQQWGAVAGRAKHPAPG